MKNYCRKLATHRPSANICLHKNKRRIHVTGLHNRISVTELTRNRNRISVTSQEQATSYHLPTIGNQLQETARLPITSRKTGFTHIYYPPPIHQFTFPLQTSPLQTSLPPQLHTHSMTTPCPFTLIWGNPLTCPSHQTSMQPHIPLI